MKTPSRPAAAVPLACACLVAIASFASPAHAGRVDLRGLSSSAAHDRFIVKYREGSPQRVSGVRIAPMLDVAVRRAGSPTRLRHVRRMSLGSDVIRADRKLDRAEAETLMRQIAADPNVEYIEVDKINRHFFTPNDPSFGVQYGFGTGPGGTYATQAWTLVNGAGTVVAVLDTGIARHSDLDANVLPGYDFIVDTFVSQDGDGRDGDPSDPATG